MKTTKAFRRRERIRKAVGLHRVQQFEAIELALRRLQALRLEHRTKPVISEFTFRKELSNTHNLSWSLNLRGERTIFLKAVFSKYKVSVVYEKKGNLHEVRMLVTERPDEKMVYKEISESLVAMYESFESEDRVVALANAYYKANNLNLSVRKATEEEDVLGRTDFWIVGTHYEVPVQFTTNSLNWKDKQRYGVPTLFVTKARFPSLETEPADLIRAFDIIRIGYLADDRRIEHIDIERLPVLANERRA